MCNTQDGEGSPFPALRFLLRTGLRVPIVFLPKEEIVTASKGPKKKRAAKKKATARKGAPR